MNRITLRMELMRSGKQSSPIHHHFETTTLRPSWNIKGVSAFENPLWRNIMRFLSGTPLGHFSTFLPVSLRKRFPTYLIEKSYRRKFINLSDLAETSSEVQHLTAMLEFIIDDKHSFRIKIGPESFWLALPTLNNRVTHVSHTDDCWYKGKTSSHSRVIALEQ